MNNIGRFALIFLLLLSISSDFFCQSSTPRERSQQLYEWLVREGFQAEKQLLTAEGNFPYSILVNFGGTDSETSQPVNRFIVALSQGTAQGCLDQLVSLLRQMEAAAGETEFTLALLANEEPPFSQDSQWHPAGSQILLNNTSDPESCALVLLEQWDGADRITVVPGSGGQLTPLWLLRQLPLPLAGNSLLTYRLDLAEDDPLLSPFFQAGMAAAAVRFDSGSQNHVTEVFAAMEAMVQDFTTEHSRSGNSQNYMVFYLWDNIWIEEGFFILIYLFITVLVLAIISGFSFLGKKGAERRKALFKIWYLIPITILLSTLFLWLGQQVATALVDTTPENAALILGIKTLFSFVVVSLPFIFHLHFRVPISQFVYGYLLTLVAAMNIFIFTSIDLVLLFIFVTEYLVIYLSRLARRIVPLILATLAMFLPFIPYALNILEYAAPDRLMNLVHSGVWGNMLYACILTPFQIMWLRILIRLDLFGTHRNMSAPRMFGTVMIVVAVIVAAVALFVFLGSFVLYRSVPGRGKDGADTASEYRLVAGNPPPAAEISVEQSGHLELRSVTVDVSASLPILRCEVSVFSADPIPVYDSVTDFQTTQDGDGATARFLIPDFPDGSLSLEYTADNDVAQQVSVAVYLATGEREAAVVEREILLAPLGEAD